MCRRCVWLCLEAEVSEAQGASYQWNPHCEGIDKETNSTCFILYITPSFKHDLFQFYATKSIKKIEQQLPHVLYTQKIYPT